MTKQEQVQVLLVEDSRGDALLIEQTLVDAKGVQFSVERACRLKEGLARLDENHFDVALLDLGLPDSQGLATLAAARKHTQDVPFVVLTGLADSEVGVEAVRQGAADYLVKGEVESDLLERSIVYALERHRLASQVAAQTQQLEASESRLRQIIDKNADAVVVVGMDGTVRFANPAAETLFGRPADDLLGEQFGFALETQEIEIARPARPATVAEMRVVETEWEGERVHLASIRDVTAHRRAEEAVRESESRYRKLFEDSPIPLREEDLSGVKAHLDALRASGVEDLGAYCEQHPEALADCARMVKVLDANRATLKLYAASSKEQLSEQFSRLFGEESHDAFREELMAIARGETSFACETFARSFADERREIVLRWRAAPGHERTLSKVWVSIVDLTRRKEAENARHRLEREWDYIFQSIGHPSMILDRAHRVVAANRAQLEFVGRPADEIVGEHCHRLCHGTDQPVPGCPMVPALESGQQASGEVVCPASGRTSLVSCSPMAVVGGRPERFIHIAWDITEHKRAQATVQQLEGEFAAARSVQEKLFPDAAPVLPGFDIAGIAQPAESTAGDYYDFIPMDGDSLGIVVGDVTSHGLGPALLMAETRAFLRAFNTIVTDVGELLGLTNRLLYQDIKADAFVTLFFGRLDPRTRVFEYASAGHQAYLMDSSGRPSELSSTSYPLGVLEDTTVPCAPPVLLEPGQILALLTDGIFEAISPEGEFLGVDRALEVIATHRDKSAEAIVQELIGAVGQFCGDQPPQDDITAVVVKVLE